MNFSLGNLVDPDEFTHPIKVENFDLGWLVDKYRRLSLIRKCEEKLGDLAQKEIVNTPVHLGIGQEAVAVGVADNYIRGDCYFGGHRSHSQFLALDGPLDGFFGEILGRETGVCSGMGGSMHLYHQPTGFHGSVPIVGGTIPICVGAGLAHKLRKSNNISVCFFGDGATEEGVLHESLNLAKMMGAQTLFVCENNLYSSHLDIRQRQPYSRVSRFAEMHGLFNSVVDGNDVVAVAKTSANLIKKIRQGEGPAFLEAVTFRWRGHVGPNEDMDVGLMRSEKELRAWKKRDPISRLKVGIENQFGIANDYFNEIEQSLDDEIESAVSNAMRAPFPAVENIEGFVYS